MRSAYAFVLVLTLPSTACSESGEGTHSADGGPHPSSGGASPSGGAGGGTSGAGSAGSPGSGGNVSSGSGGAVGSGGTAGQGGSLGTGGAPACGPLGARVRTSTVAAPGGVLAGDEYHPVVIAPRPGGGSWLSYRAADAESIAVVPLTEADAPASAPLSFTGREVLAAIATDASGGAIVVTSDDPEIYSDKYCVSDATPDRPGRCQKVDLLRFDDTGTTTFRSTLTKKVNVDADGALFLWWYQYTARLAWDGSRYGVYFRSAGSSPRPGAPGEIDIHAGDTFRFVGPGGAVEAGGWDWGCSHSWAIRLAYGGTFAAACHGDAFPNALRVALVDPGGRGARQELRLLEGQDPTDRALGGLVAAGDAFWLAYIAAEGGGRRLRLARITSEGAVAADVPIDAAVGLDAPYPFRAYLAAYGSDRLLVGWKSGDGLQLAVLDRTTGALLEGPAAVSASIDDFEEFVTTPSGDVVFANAENRSEAVSVNRVPACR